MIKFAPPAGNIKELNHRNRKVLFISCAIIVVLSLIGLIWLK
ncbi:MAG: hypothetical protein ACXV5R_08450 [Candidatus Angelobacter sp.]